MIYRKAMLKAHVFQAWDENERSVQPENVVLLKRDAGFLR
jgi:hypothetical protein